MARVVRPTLLLIAVMAALLATPAAALGDPPPPGEVTVELPDGATLPPGRYPVEIRTPDGTVSADVVVAGTPAPPPSTSENVPTGQSTEVGAPSSSAAAPATEEQPAAEQSDSSVGTILFVLLAGFLLISIGRVCHSRLFVPRRHVRAFRAAVDMIRRGDHASALPVLSRVELLVPEKLRPQARFFYAFALFRLDSLDEAEHLLATLHRATPQDVDVAYLLAYLRTKRRDYDGAEPVLEAIEAAGGMDSGPARRLYGIVEFHRALEALRSGRVDAAAMLFQKVERLGDFADRVPADLRNQHVVLGAQALFDRDLVAARGQFEDLTRAAVEDATGDERESMLASADIGLALAAWLENTPKSMVLVDPLLANAAKRLDPAADTETAWTYVPDESSVAARLAALTGRQERTTELDERDLALRSIHLLRAAAMLRVWAADDNVPADDRERLDEVLSRLACARERDPEFSDPYLVAGLLKCYLATSEGERADGVALLRHAQRLGVREPDLVRILNEDARLGRARRDAADQYLQVLDQYVENPSVRQEVRVSLLARLSRYGKVRPLDRRPELAKARVVSPTVDEMNGRSELLRERVNQLMTARDGDERLTAARQLAQNLENDSRVLAEQAHSMETREADLLVLLGDWLLGEGER